MEAQYVTCHEATYQVMCYVAKEHKLPLQNSLNQL